MTLRSTIHAPVLAAVLVFALASCGGSTSKPDFGPGDDIEDPDLIDVDVESDATDATQADDGTAGGDDATAVDTNTPDATDVPGEAVNPPDVREDTGLPSQCPCDENIVGAEVCLQDPITLVRTQFKSEVCAQCALCADGPDCVGCTGTKADCVTLPEANYFTWRGQCAVCPCDKTAECERIAFPGCGKVCADNAGTPTEYADVCAMKDGLNCRSDYDTYLNNFGVCPPPACEACVAFPENKVCASDGKTYANQCSLANCGAPATRACQGECVGPAFCPSCGTDCTPVCGEDGIPYANACAATTCGTGTKKVAYEGRCCPDCDAIPVNEVCGNDGNTYKNQCTAICNGAVVCGNTGTTVCGNDGNTYANACLAACHGGVLHVGACVRICEQCPTVLSPICADNTTYQSTCFETCLGGIGGTPGLCTACINNCGTIASPKVGTTDGPHCGADGITYPTSCFPVKCFGETATPGTCQ